jgi:Putative peptidoglycan binding domain.
MKFKLLVLAVVTSASGLMAQTHFQVRPITIHGAVPAVHNVNPLVVPRTVTPVNPVVRNVSPVRPLQVQPQTVIQPQRLSPAQSRALDNAVFANNYNLYRDSHESHVVPNQTVETQANHIARLQGIIQSGTQPVSVQPGAGLGYGTTSASFSGKTIRQTQTALRQLGYYHGEVDGLFGPLTQEALKNYQHSTNQPATGLFDRQSLSQLGVGAQ